MFYLYLTKMKQHLTLTFELSGVLPQESKEDLNNFFTEYSTEINNKIKEGNFSIDSWTSKDKELELSLLSELSLSPHVAVLQLRKRLSTSIGKKYRIGIRGFKFKSYNIDIELEQKPIKEFTLPLTKSISFVEKDGKSFAHIEIDPEIGEDFVEKGAIERIVKRVGDKIAKQYHGSKKEHHEIVWYTGEKGHFTTENPTKLLQDAKWIHRTNYRNQWIFTPSIAVLVEGLKQVMVDYVYKPLGYYNMLIPKLVDWSVWLRSGHAEGIYQGGFEPYLVVQPKNADPEFFEEVADYITITKTIPEDLLYQKISAPMGGLSYAQCPPCWAWFQGKTISKDSLPIKVYDWSGPTYRYESGSAYGFERVDELHRIESLFIGTPEQTQEIGIETRKKFKEVFEDVLELEFREARVMPWWLQQSAKDEENTEASDMIVGTIDFESYMPYRGNRKESEWLEIQNISIIGDKYPKGFSVKTEGGKELWSGCGGGSFERFITAFVAQKGLDQKNWPDKLRKYVDSIPPPVKFL